MKLKVIQGNFKDSKQAQKKEKQTKYDLIGYK